MSEPIVSSLAKALRVLECFTVSEPELGVTEISKSSGSAKSNAHNIISTYCQMAICSSFPTGNTRSATSCSSTRSSSTSISATPTRCTISLLEAAGAHRAGRLLRHPVRNGRSVSVCRPSDRADEGAAVPRDLRRARPLWPTGIGKAILANLPPEEWLPGLPELFRRTPRRRSPIRADPPGAAAYPRARLRHRQQRARAERPLRRRAGL